MSISLEECKAFIKDAEKARDNWLMMAKLSWYEIKKRNDNGKLWTINRNYKTNKGKYPAWNSIFKIRQPLILSRIGIPVCKDTTQDGNDGIGATAAILRERLAINLAKDFEMLDTMCSSRDDFCATDFSTVRAYYECKNVKEEVKEYLTPQQSQDPITGAQNVVFYDTKGNQVFSDNISQDDQGYYLETEQVVDVEDERVYLEHILFDRFYVDPDVRRWQRCKRIAYKHTYSPRSFIDVFGSAAYAKLAHAKEQNQAQEESDSKRESIDVYEYWDEYDNEVLWFSDESLEFLKPIKQLIPDDDEEQTDETRRGLYDLEKFFPSPPPLIVNNPTDEFWPIPEYYQQLEILEDIHRIFNRLIALTKAIRVRLLFDNNVEGLQAAISEAREGDAIGVPNLAQALTAAGGSLDNVAQYLNVAPLIEGLNQMYTALEQRLNILYKNTGTSDLLQGLVTDPTQRTFGERQMTEKYALNQIAERQRRMAEFVRDCYELLTEMALKNFKDESLDKYIMPNTLEPQDQQNYRAALGMLKEDNKRFRIELETDSTIAINEEYDKAMRAEIVNTLTGALEKTANIANTAPELLQVNLHALKFLIQGMRQGKMFQSEITESIDNVIQKTQIDAQNQPPPFDKDQAQLELDTKKLEQDGKLQEYKILSDERLQTAKIQQDAQLAGLQNQLDQFKLQFEAGKNQSDNQFMIAKMQSDIQLAQEEIQLKHDALMIEAQKISDKTQLDQFLAVNKSQLDAANLRLSQMGAALEQQKVMLDEKEKYATEARLQSEHELEKLRTQIEMAARMQEMKAQQAPPVQEAPVVNIHMPAPAKTKKVTKVQRDALGNITNFESQDIQDPTSNG